MNLYRSDARTCSARCRQKVSRAEKRARNRVENSVFPVEMTQKRRWIRREPSKRPITITGRSASTANPDTWSSFRESLESTAGAGMGFVLGEGVGAYDLDHCLHDGVLEPWAADFIASIPEKVIFAEVSQSGDGVHLFIEAPEGPGCKIRDGRNIERYTAGRYIAVTGDVFTFPATGN